MKFQILAALASLSATAVHAGADLVSWPDNFESRFVRYVTVDKPERKPPIVRFMYVNPESLADARAGEPLPSGTVLVMEDHAAALDAAGQAVLDATGRLRPTSTITNIFVQEKRTGWGSEYPEAVRNGEWEYARFKTDGEVDPTWTFDKCFECHKSRSGNADFNFSFGPFIDAMKKPH